jgi:hypothetical protein
LNACPLCGGKTGYRNKVLIEYEKRTLWSDVFYLMRKKVHKEYLRRYCLDCNKCVSAALDAPTFKL